MQRIDEAGAERARLPMETLFPGYKSVWKNQWKVYIYNRVAVYPYMLCWCLWCCTRVVQIILSLHIKQAADNKHRMYSCNHQICSEYYVLPLAKPALLCVVPLC